MKKRQVIFWVFGICFLIAVILFIFSFKNSSPAGMVMQAVFSPFQKTALKLSGSFHPKSQIESLSDENAALKTQLAKLQIIAQDNLALRDQFQTADINPKTLLPAEIVGMPSFFPGISAPEELVIDKGKKDGVDSGSVVVFKDNLIGIIQSANDHFAKITVVGNKSTSFTARTSRTGALGVIRGEGNGQMVLDNVILSDSLQTGDLVVTAGDTAVSGKGYPPGLVVGKITSVEKSPSALFQRANLQILINVSRITTVFVIAGEK